MSDRERLLDIPLSRCTLAVIDLEFTGLDPERDRICEIAVVRRSPDGSLDEFQQLVRPPVSMSSGARRVTRITDEQLKGQPVFEDIVDELLEWISGAVLVAHNVDTDLVFLLKEIEAAGRVLPPPVAIDTLSIARRLFAFPQNSLTAVCERFGVANDQAHRALSDAHATWEVFVGMLAVLDPEERLTAAELDGLVDALGPSSPTRLRQERLLREAYRERRTVWIDYISTADPLQGVVHREVAIWRLRLPRIQGYCYLRKGERVFHLDRIRDVQSGSRTYEIPDFRRRI